MGWRKLAVGGIFSLGGQKMGLVFDNQWCSQKEGDLVLVAGPCSAESEEQLLATAFRLLKVGNISLFRAGVWKPRTRPDSFEGIGEKALSWLVRVKEETGLPVATEVANARHVELALQHGIDVLWLGARTTANPFSVQEIADSLRGVSVPIMIKNPIHADLSLWIGAIERIYNAGLTNVTAIHRGFATGEVGKYRNRPFWRIPIELKRHFPQLPMICDPSHISGNRALLSEICQKALDRGMNGLMVEVHYRPEQALSDSLQQVTPEGLGHILDNLQLKSECAPSVGFEREIERLRDKLNLIDQDIMKILKMRMDIVDEIGELKKKNNVTAFQVARMNKMLAEYREQAEEFHLEKDYVEEVFNIIHNQSVKKQTWIFNRPF